MNVLRRYERNDTASTRLPHRPAEHHEHDARDEQAERPQEGMDGFPVIPREHEPTPPALEVLLRLVRQRRWSRRLHSATHHTESPVDRTRAWGPHGALNEYP